MNVDLCDIRRMLRADFFAKDRDVTLQSGRVFDGLGTIPIGGIILWSGSVASIPTGWQLCNGTNGTPDLRNNFVIGAGDTYAVDDTGGSTTKDLSHQHGPGTLNTASDTHSHDVAGTSGSESSHTHGDGSYATGTASKYFVTLNGLEESFTFTPDDHTHDVTGTSGTGSSHSHTSGTYATDNDSHDHNVDSGQTASGGSATQDIMPPYYALAYIQRLS